MNTSAYLARIQLQQTPQADLASLLALHRQHVIHVPFENLDIHRNVKLQLDKAHLYHKIVGNRRGGFCYELNHLFYLLLQEIGFDARMIAARIFDDGQEGPPFDHMALLIHFGKTAWLADVGFGDLFIEPLPLRTDQTIKDDLHSFRLENGPANSYLLYKSENGRDFKKIYAFETDARQIEQFQSMCDWKERSPDSYFVKNKICTLPLTNGRRTLFNQKFTQRIDGRKSSAMIESEEAERQLLADFFGISYP
ncbi:MAG: arylamine N-acetyltransferase [Bacteroidota bacterium]